MTVLKATFRTNDEQGRIEINVTWHKQLPGVYGAPSGYVVTENDIEAHRSEGIDIALHHAVRLFKRYEKESNQRTTAQSKIT